jgi:hypothetical protein
MEQEVPATTARVDFSRLEVDLAGLDMFQHSWRPPVIPSVA